jgi:REP element-mobilizing transposase RayT
MSGHVHMMIAIAPKLAVPQVIGFIRSGSAIHLAQMDEGRRRGFAGP